MLSIHALLVANTGKRKIYKKVLKQQCSWTTLENRKATLSRGIQCLKAVSAKSYLLLHCQRKKRRESILLAHGGKVGVDAFT